MTQRIRLGISTCPNDTFAFHGLLTRAVDWRGLDFQIELLDVETLNERLLAGDFDVCKASFHAALLAADRVVVLPSGSALGFGVGPLLLAAQPGTRPTHAGQLTLCPGRHTTAALLFDLFYPRSTRVEQVVFSEIMPRLQARTADFGVCIHEGDSRGKRTASRSSKTSAPVGRPRPAVRCRLVASWPAAGCPPRRSPRCSG